MSRVVRRAVNRPGFLVYGLLAAFLLGSAMPFYWSFLLGSHTAEIAAPGDLPIRKPSGDALEARPPQRARLGPLHQRREIFLADTSQGARRIARLLRAHREAFLGVSGTEVEPGGEP